ncbi:MAG: sugar ABC transporter substrate-binding protein [Bacillota bacterium]|nr:sugar ABC transporter substrate-binding protein [Bacillota bacterium]
MERTGLICKAAVLFSAAALLTGAGCSAPSGAEQNAGTGAPAAVTVGDGTGAESGASAEMQTPGGEKTRPLSIDVVLKTNSSEYWGYVQVGCLAYAKEHPEISISVKGASAETAMEEQENIVRTDLMEDRFDAYVIAPLNPAEIAELLKKTDRPVIALDTPIDSDRVLAYCGTDNQKASGAGALEAVNMAKERGWKEIRAVNIAGVEGDRVSELRAQGYRESIEAEGGTFLSEETVYAESSPKKASAAMRDIIRRHPEGIAIIACNNDDVATAALAECLKAPAYRNTVVLGFDGIGSACERLLENSNYENYVTVAQNPYEMGYMAVEAAVNALNGRAIRQSSNIVDGRTFIDVGFNVITRKNAYGRMEMLQKFWE